MSQKNRSEIRLPSDKPRSLASGDDMLILNITNFILCNLTLQLTDKKIYNRPLSRAYCNAQGTNTDYD